MGGNIIVFKKLEIIGKFYLDAVRQVRSIPKKLKRMTVMNMQSFSQFIFY